MKIRIPVTLLALGLTLALPLPRVFADAAKPTPAVGEEVLLSITATIEKLNLETREVSLKGPAGNVYTFTVDPRVKRLAEFKVGDAVTLDYYASLAAEFDAVHVATQEAFDRVLASSRPGDWAEDRIHPNLPGHAVLADAFLNAIETAPASGA